MGVRNCHATCPHQETSIFTSLVYHRHKVGRASFEQKNRAVAADGQKLQYTCERWRKKKVAESDEAAAKPCSMNDMSRELRVAV